MTRWLALAASVLLGIALVVVFLVPDEGSQTATPTRPDPTSPSTETLDQQIERVARVVEQVRELEFDTIPDPTIVSPDELEELVAEELQAYTPEQAAEDERILVALGVLDPADDLRALIIRSYSEQVAGFYDPETKELVVGAQELDTRLGRLEEIILAHELQHALADAVLGLPTIEDDTDGQEDRILARQALTEGDATVTMQLYVEEGFSVVDQLLLPAEVAELGEQFVGVTELPHYLQRSLLFPYEDGAAFVTYLLDSGGWDAVDQAYRQPPSTTAEILFPERYPAGEILPVVPVGDLEEPWSLVRSSEFGAADLLFLFEAPGDDPAVALADPLGSAAAWRGGALELHTNGDDTAVGVTLATDDLPTLCRAVEEWYDAAHSDDVRVDVDAAAEWGRGTWSASLVCDADSVRLGIAPTVETARALAVP